jgi:hypothetical protein
MMTSKGAAEDEQNADQAREAARLCRVDIYSSWLADDVDGLTHNLVSADLVHISDAPTRPGCAWTRLLVPFASVKPA